MSTPQALDAFAVKERGRNKPAFWTRIGRAFPHKTGPGFTLELDALPTDGKIVLMPPKEKQPAADTFEAEVPNG